MKITHHLRFQNLLGGKILKTVSTPHLTLNLFALLVIILFGNISSANNLSVSNVSLTGINTGSQYIMVKCNIAWDNSWRTSSAPTNWDAA